VAGLHGNQILLKARSDAFDTELRSKFENTILIVARVSFLPAV